MTVTKDDGSTPMVRAVKRISIDPGHGGTNTGVVAPPWPTAPEFHADVDRGYTQEEVDQQRRAWDVYHAAIQDWRPRLVEKAWTLATALKLEAALLELRGVDVVLTRREDEELSLAGRVAVAHDKAADLSICLHVNSNEDAAVHGLMAFHRPGDAVGELVGTAIEAAAPQRLRPAKPHSSAAVVDVWPRVHNVLDGYRCPVVLVECGFVTNRQDLEALLDEDVRHGVVTACVAGVVRFLQG